MLLIKWSEGNLPLTGKDSVKWESLSKTLWSTGHTHWHGNGGRAQLLPPLESHDLTQGFPSADQDINRKNKIMGISMHYEMY